MSCKTSCDKDKSCCGPLKYYLVYDGRGEYSTDDAIVVETIGQKTEKQAIKEFKRGHKDTDNTLFSYDLDCKDYLINEQRVYV